MTNLPAAALPPTWNMPPQALVFVYIVAGVLALGVFAGALNAILALLGKFTTPKVTYVEFAEYKRRTEWIESHIDPDLKRRVAALETSVLGAYGKIDHVQEAMTAAAEARSDKLLTAIQNANHKR